MDAESAVSDLERKIDTSQKTEAATSTDQAGDREKLTALKGNDAATRFADELKHTADLELQKQAALDKFNSSFRASPWTRQRKVDNPVICVKY